MTQASFKYTFPISKAEERADGFYITGFASGPEVDTEGERMAPEAIERFAEQINSSDPDMRLTYRDAHAPDGVLRDLGDITRAWVNEHFHLGVEVKLNMDNPASEFLFKNIKRGKQYGMSVAGHVVDYANEFVDEVGKNVLTYKNVVLDEISNTTRPAWYPSFGTVLAKSIKDASPDAPKEGNEVDPEKDDTTLPGTEDATKSDGAAGTDDTTEKAADAAAAESTDETTEKAAESTDEDVEKAGRKVSGVTAAELLGAFQTMQSALTNIGVLTAPATEDVATDSEKSASGSDEDTTEKTDGADSTEPVITKSDLDALAADLKKANERIAELEARPATQVPGVITDATKAETESDLAEFLSKASPSDKMRLAFALQTQGR